MGIYNFNMPDHLPQLRKILRLKKELLGFFSLTNFTAFSVLIAIHLVAYVGIFGYTKLV